MSVPAWKMRLTLPCIGTGARTTSSAERLADRLVAETDAEDRDLPAAAAIRSRQMPASFGVHGPGDSTIASGSRGQGIGYA